MMRSGREDHDSNNYLAGGCGRSQCRSPAVAEEEEGRGPAVRAVLLPPAGSGAGTKEACVRGKSSRAGVVVGAGSRDTRKRKEAAAFGRCRGASVLWDLLVGTLALVSQ
jgi:hypothetical protein